MFQKDNHAISLHVSILMAATLVLTSSIGARPSNMSPGATEGLQVIEVTAKKYEFNPPPIRVKQGTRVQLKITATDHVHGFRVTEFPDGANTKEKAGLVLCQAQVSVSIKNQENEVMVETDTPTKHRARFGGWTQ
jgi:plastocyanin